MDDLLTGLSRARATLTASIDGLTDRQMTSGEVVPGYTVQDLLGHLAAWDHEILAAVEAYLNGGPPYRADMATADVDAWNMRARDRRRDMAMAPLQTRLVCLMTRGELGSVLAAAPPEIADHVLDYPWGERGTLRALVERYAIEHDLAHAAQIRAWRDHEGGNV